jgi:hypothetical protein
MKNAVFLLIAVLGVLELAVGQETITQNSVFAVGKINPSWSYQAETHFVRGDFLKEARQYILRPSATFSLSKHVEVSGEISYLYNASYSDGPSAASEEFNSWEQVGVHHNLGRLNFFHWVRTEQRHNVSGYSQRLRYRITLSTPLELFAGLRFDAISFNEHFVRAKNMSFDGFDQNWTFVGVQFPIGEHLMFRSGYRNTLARRGGENIHLNTLQSWLSVKVL